MAPLLIVAVTYCEAVIIKVVVRTSFSSVFRRWNRKAFRINGKTAVMLSMTVEKFSRLKPGRAFKELKDILFKEKSEIVREEPPTIIAAKHGSFIKGGGPKIVRMKMIFRLMPKKGGTKIIGESSLDSEYVFATSGVGIFSFLFGFAIVLFSWGMVEGLILGGMCIVLSMSLLISLIYQHIKRDTFLEYLLKQLT